MRPWTMATFLLYLPSLCASADTSDIASEIRDARAFLSQLYSAKDEAEVRKQIQARVSVGDSLRKHRALLGEAMRTKYNPYSDRFVFAYCEGGKERTPGSQGYWVLTIQTDSTRRISHVRVGIARR